VLGVSGSPGFGPQEHFASTKFKPDLGVGIEVMVVYAIVGLVSGMVMALRKEE
jgi:hypothetical protein